MSDPAISLVLVTYNSAPLLPAFFAALAATRGVTYELIAVDNASSDGTAEALARHAEVRLIANRENIGFGRACNQGARAARGGLLVFLNADVLATPEWLLALAARMRERPDAAIIAPQTLRPGAPPPAPGQAPIEVAAVPGCAMMIRRSAWERLGGFDEQIFLYWEDTEICWRAWLAGWRVLEDREAYVVHARGGSGGGAQWDAEAMKNGIYAHLKLLRPRAALPYLARQALKTALAAARGQGRPYLAAWRWNLARLGHTLAQRRAIRHAAAGDARALEARVSAHAARQRRERSTA